MSVYITPQDELHVEHEGIAGVLLEVMRDLLYQTFVRKARLMQAMTYRQHVAPIRVETVT
jgi:hypothetical protein